MSDLRKWWDCALNRWVRDTVSLGPLVEPVQEAPPATVKDPYPALMREAIDRATADAQRVRRAVRRVTRGA